MKVMRMVISNSPHLLASAEVDVERKIKRSVYPVSETSNGGLSTSRGSK